MHQYVHRAANVLAQHIDHEAVLILPEQGEIKVLNEVGPRIWTLATGRHTLVEIATMITSEFDVGLDQATQDVRTFVEELLRRGMLVVGPAQ